jgi:ankyrin repeat protein
MDCSSLAHSLENLSLHAAAIKGDCERTRKALDGGADVNAVDSVGRTALACAVFGEWYSFFSFTCPKSSRY